MILRSGSVTAREFASITKVDVEAAEKAIQRVDDNKDKVLNRREFHNLMNQNRLRNPSVGSGDRAFTSLDKNRVVTIQIRLVFRNNIFRMDMSLQLS